MNVAVIGGGAAGFFSALAVKEHHPSAKVTIFEKTKKLLSKVKISGGGRCNVTNGEPSIKVLSTAYPRGEKKLKNAFRVFNNQHTMEWFESRGVALVTQEDGCVFPVSQDSQSIIDCFLKEAKRLNIKIETSAGVAYITNNTDQLTVHFSKNESRKPTFDKVIVATGGTPKRAGLDWLAQLEHQIKEPVPSLFTFNMPNETIRELMGIVVENTLVKVQGTKLTADGPLLITHWGMSGPAILKLSAWGARLLNDMNYECAVQVNWTNIQNDQIVTEDIRQIAKSHAQKIIANYRPYDLPDRLWQYLILRHGLDPQKRWSELGKKGINKIVTFLTNDVYQVKGKTTFKEEFVTCGGVSLESIDFKTMQSRVCPNLYYAGEILDIDGITGGYNFQSAWTTAYIAGKLC